MHARKKDESVPDLLQKKNRAESTHTGIKSTYVH